MIWLVILATFCLFTGASGQAEDGSCKDLECDVPPAAQWSEWSDWGVCMTVAGQGTAYRNRECRHGISDGVMTHCEGSFIQSKPCTVEPTTISPKATMKSFDGFICQDTASIKAVHLPLSKDENIPHGGEVYVIRAPRSVLKEAILDDPLVLDGLVIAVVALLFYRAVVWRLNRALLYRRKICCFIARNKCKV